MITPAGIPSEEAFGSATVTRIGVRNLSEQDVKDLAEHIVEHVLALTLAKFLGLK